MRHWSRMQSWKTQLVASAFFLSVAGTIPVGNTDELVLWLVEDESSGLLFPPGGRLTSGEFWTAAPTTQDSAPVLGNHYGPSRPAADFVGSGESDMLGWQPPCDRNATGISSSLASPLLPFSSSPCRVEPLADTQTLVRFLGGLRASDFPTNGTDKSAGDVVVALPGTGQLEVSSLALKHPPPGRSGNDVQ